jgi:hypothetical protein
MGTLALKDKLQGGVARLDVDGWIAQIRGCSKGNLQIILKGGWMGELHQRQPIPNEELHQRQPLPIDEA